MTGGGTAGHCIPNLAIYPYLKDKVDEIHYIGSESGIEKTIIGNIMPYHSIHTVKFERRKIAVNLSIPIKLKKAVKECYTLLNQIKPDLVFSKGGFVGLPVALAAYKLHLPVIIHESDYTVGLANKLCQRKAEYFLTSFSDTAEKYKNGVYSGSPIKTQISDDKMAARKKLGITSLKPILLVFGGSSGAAFINEKVREQLDRLTEKFFVFHITGKGNTDNKINSKDYMQAEFCQDMSLVYSASDVVLSRAGSNSAFELMAANLPTLFIPLSKRGSRGDQLVNAEYFRKRHLCKVLTEENVDGDRLVNNLFTLYDSRDKYIERMKNAPMQNGAKIISDIIIYTLNSQKKSYKMPFKVCNRQL